VTSPIAASPAPATVFTNRDLVARNTVSTVGVANGTRAAASGTIANTTVSPVGGPSAQIGTGIATFSDVGNTPSVGYTEQGDAGGLGVDAAPLPVENAVRAYEASMARLSAKADEVDAAFGQYRVACVGVSAPWVSMGGRQWMGLWNGTRTNPSETREACAAILSTAMRLGEQVQHGMRGADDMARRSGVLPGITRQIRAQYNMDWSGWDR